MTDHEFESLLKQSIKNYGEKYIDCPEDLDKPFEFSEKFEKKMDKLIKKKKRFYYSLIGTAGKRVACIASALVIAVSGSVITVKAIRNKTFEFIAEPKNGGDGISANIDSDIFYPKTIELEYTIDVPEGFEIDEEQSDYLPDSISLYYTNGDKFIDFEQRVVNDVLGMAIDNERSKVEHRTDENGVEYMIYFWEEDNKYNVLWENYGYFFMLNTNYDGKEIIDLCQLIEKK